MSNPTYPPVVSGFLKASSSDGSTIEWACDRCLVSGEDVLLVGRLWAKEHVCARCRDVVPASRAYPVRPRKPEFVRHRWARRPERDFEGHRQYQCEGECKQWVAYPNDDAREPDGCCWLAEVGDTVTPGDYPGHVIAVDFDRREVMVGFGSTLADQRESAIPLSFDDVARLLKEDAGVLPSPVKAMRERQAP